jgi:hypothetical protein
MRPLTIAPLTGRQDELLIGSILGDGSIQQGRAGNAWFTKGQKASRQEYVQWLHDELLPYSCRAFFSVKKYRLRTGEQRESLAFVMATHQHATFTALRQHWYPQGVKIVPADIHLTPLALAIWYCDDGTNNTRLPGISLATNCFALNDVQRLAKELSRLGIDSGISNEKGGHRIDVRSRYHAKFLDLVRPHIPWDCFQYKLDPGRVRRHPRVIDFWLLDPSGERHHVTNLFQFSRAHGLNYASVVLLTQGKYQTTKGWRLA